MTGNCVQQIWSNLDRSPAERKKRGKKNDRETVNQRK